MRVNGQMTPDKVQVMPLPFCGLLWQNFCTMEALPITQPKVLK